LKPHDHHSGTVLLATLSLYLFGGGVINDFAFTFLVGILTGLLLDHLHRKRNCALVEQGERPRVGAGSGVRIRNRGRSSTTKAPRRTAGRRRGAELQGPDSSVITK
jgi:hypothetical protein